MRVRKGRKGEGGFTLVEIVVAMVMMTIIAVGFIGIMIYAAKRASTNFVDTRENVGARAVADAMNARAYEDAEESKTYVAETVGKTDVKDYDLKITDYQSAGTKILDRPAGDASSLTEGDAPVSDERRTVQFSWDTGNGSGLGADSGTKMVRHTVVEVKDPLSYSDNRSGKAVILHVFSRE
ncbi:MAG: type II secretion system GspH family protein [Clostridiales bacterium]|jgi:Tfp pilus assembly protein PilV|nr:type II secretion system GspH family protein [Clostridiales bacterium]